MNNQKGVSLIVLIVTIAVMIIIATITIRGNNNALNYTSESVYKAELRGLEERLRIYHEDAELELFEYRKNKLQWDGVAARATNTGKVEDAQAGIEEESRREDTAQFIFKEIPGIFKGKLYIEDGNLGVLNPYENQKKWLKDMEVQYKEN